MFEGLGIAAARNARRQLWLKLQRFGLSQD